MTSRRAPRAGIVLLQHLIPDNESLIGDLIEECAERSHAWFWRQVIFVVLARMTAHASANLRQRASLEGALASVAILIVLSFQVVVAAHLLKNLLERLHLARIARTDHSEWLPSVTILSFLAAWAIGQATSRLHRRSRVASVLVYGGSATLAALLTLALLNPAPMRSFLPSPYLQTAAAMVFVIGLLVGTSGPSPGDQGSSWQVAEQAGNLKTEGKRKKTERETAEDSGPSGF